MPSGRVGPQNPSPILSRQNFFSTSRPRGYTRATCRSRIPQSRIEWRQRNAEYNYQVLYKIVFCNVQADVFSRFRTLAQIATDNWGEIPSLLLSVPLVKRKLVNRVANTVVLRNQL